MQLYILNTEVNSVLNIVLNGYSLLYSIGN